MSPFFQMEPLYLLMDDDRACRPVGGSKSCEEPEQHSRRTGRLVIHTPNSRSMASYAKLYL